MRSKVSSTLGFSSASMAESDMEFSMSSSSSKLSSEIGISASRPGGGLRGAVAGAAAAGSSFSGAVMSTLAVFLPSGPA